jgi:hypothetical protein
MPTKPGGTLNGIGLAERGSRMRRRSGHVALSLCLAAASGFSAPIDVRADEPQSETVADPAHASSVGGIMPVAPAPVVPAPTLGPSPPLAPSLSVGASPPASFLPPAREARFGDARVLVVNGTITGAIHGSNSVGSATYDLTVAPGFNYFVAPNFSAGASVLIGYDRITPSGTLGETTWRFGVTGQLGFDLWLSERLSLWPSALLTCEQIRVETFVAALPPSGLMVAPAGADVASIVSTEIYAPLLFHPAKHFFIGFGPFVSTDLHNSTGFEGTSNRATVFGASSTIGGWL